MSCHSSENDDDVPLQNIRSKLTRKSKLKENKRFKKEFCCICLNNVFGLSSVKNRPKCVHVSYFTMLERTVPEIEWCAAYHICTPCSYSLIDAHTFWDTCVNNSFLTKKPLLSDNKEVVGSLHKVDSFQPKKEDECENKPDKINYNVITDQEVINSKSQETTEQNSCEDGVKNEKLDIKKELTDLAPDIENDSHFDEHDVTDNEKNKEKALNKSLSKKTKVKRTSSKRTVIKQKRTYKKRSNKEFRCEKCEFITTQSNQLVNHYVEVHRLKSDDIKPFKCDSCQKAFQKFWSLKAHAKSHEDDRPFVCSYCGKGFKRDADLQGHEKRHLNTREYKCELCGKGYNTYKDLGSHKVAVHTDPTKWKWVCEVCSKPFPIKSNYESHMRRHKGDKKFACYLCPKRFTDKIVLQKHLRVHSNVRNFKCSECEKEYKEENSLLIHMARIHSIGVDRVKIPQKVRNRYICHICPKAFGGKDKLTKHLYQHSGERPFGCSVCDKKFIDKSYVKQHMRRAHGILDSAKCIVEEMLCR